MRSDHWHHVAQLVERSRSGDSAAFRQLLEMHRSAVTSTLVACGVRCPQTARDLAQEVSLKVWTKLDSLHDQRSFPAWIRRIAANAARDHLRRVAARREEALETALDLESDDDPHLEAERVAELRLMLAALSEEDDDIVELLVARAQGVSVEELASSLAISQGALKMRLLRVRQRLKQRLDALRHGRDREPPAAS